MSDPLVPVGEGHTEVSEEDRVGLLPTYIATRGELFQAEEENIAAATFGRKPAAQTLLDDLYLRRLHQAMFDQVWKWAGKYRTRETNIGIEPTLISAALRELVHNTRVWVELSSFDADETAVRFHHRIVQIHPFVNGNGRHGRIAADLLIRALGRDPFTWGRNLSVGTAELRARYHAALRRVDADPDDIVDLAAFARS
ncbi:MAG TPA: mobile mystery protein B [Acidimicrobiales bacterium]|nr:mobile mystery protein B [Acidimicrobiales bacterium]